MSDIDSMPDQSASSAETMRPGEAGIILPTRAALVGVGLLSGLADVLYLTGPCMLEVYHRVLPSRSVLTLVGLAAIALGRYVFQALFDPMRSRLLVRIRAMIEQVSGVQRGLNDCRFMASHPSA